jgi:hypothetical protein
MGERRDVHVSFEAPGVGLFEEQDLRTKILNKTGDGLGWEVSATNPMTVYRDFEDDASFGSALAELQGLAGGPDFAREFHDFEADFWVEVAEPELALGDEREFPPGSYRVIVRRHFPTEGITPEGALASGDVWYELDVAGASAPVWIREIHTKPAQSTD